MNRRSLSRCVLAGVFAALPFTVHAQGSCTGTVTYTPQNPVYPQPITATFTAQSSIPATGTLDGEYLLSFSATGQGTPTQGFPQGELFRISNVPSSASFTFTPYAPGQVTLSGTSLLSYSYGATPLCGSYGPGPGQTVVITVAPAPVTPPTYDGLRGQYAFSFNGLNPQIQGASTQLAAIGSFTADGQGHITAGTEDVNSGAGSSTLVPITGSYTIDAQGNGALKLKSSFGVQQLSFFLPALQVQNVTSTPIFSTDGYVIFGTGLLQQQTIPGTTPDNLGNYAISLNGYLPCSTTCNGGAQVFEGGSIAFNNSSTATTYGTLNASVGAVLLSSIPVGNTQFTGFDTTTGRFTFTLTQGSYPALHFVGYTVDGAHLILLSTDSHKSTYLLSGTATL